MASTPGENLVIDTKEEATETRHQGSLKCNAHCNKELLGGRLKKHRTTSNINNTNSGNEGQMGDDG